MKKNNLKHGKSRYDKYKCRCAVCTKANTDYNYDYRQRNIVKLRQYKKKYNKKWRKENGYHNEINSKKRYPKKEAARSVLKYAVKKGLILRGACEIPGCKSTKTHGHHDDYSKPLAVRWLCPLHHTEVHRNMRKRVIIPM